MFLKKKNAGMVILLVCFIFSCFFLYKPVKSDQNQSWFVLGSGPLKNELGYPVKICQDSQGNLYVLDGLKSCISKYDHDGNQISSFSIFLPVSSYYNEIHLAVSLDDLIYLGVNNSLYVYAQSGALDKTYQMNTLPGFIGRVGNKILPIRDHVVVFKDSASGYVWIGSLDNEKSPPRQLSDNEGSPIVAIDITINQNYLYILNAPFGDLRNSTATLFVFTLQGDFSVQKSLSYLANFPTGISINNQGDLSFLCGHTFFYILQSPDYKISAEGSVRDLSSKMQFTNTLSFCGYSHDSILICDSYQGILNVQDQNTTSFLSNKKSDTMAPFRITGDTTNIFTYDLLSERIAYFHNDQLQKSVTLNDILANAGSTNFGGDIQLFPDSDASLFIAIKHIELTLIQYNFLDNKAEIIPLPAYIPPKGSVHYRQQDKTFFVFSWFNGILYSFDKKGENITKLEIPCMKSQSYSDQSIITVDGSNFVYILMPVLRKVRVIDPKGFLVSEFVLPMEGSYVDLTLVESILCFLNYSNGTLYFCTKRGENLYSIGEQGNILYPNDEEDYQSKAGFFNFPSDIWGADNFIYITDTGNSRIQILSLKNVDEDPSLRISIVLQIGSRSAYVNDVRMELDVPPFTRNGRTLVPFRFIGEALKAEVIWDASKKMASYILDGNRVDVILGSTTAYVNSTPMKLDVAPVLEEGRTFVPLRFVTEALGASVIWEANTKKIYITYPGK